MTDDQTYIRRAASRDRYLIIAKTSVEDERLSFRARGVLTFILSKPDHWRVRADHLASCSPEEGRRAVLTAMAELRAAGYMRTVKTQDPETGLWRSETLVYESPDEADAAQLPLDLGPGDGHRTPDTHENRPSDADPTGVRSPAVGSPNAGGPGPGQPPAVVSTETVSTESEGLQDQGDDDLDDADVVELDGRFPTRTPGDGQLYVDAILDWWEAHDNPPARFSSLAEKYRAAVRIAASAGPWDPTANRPRWVQFAVTLVTEYLVDACGADMPEPQATSHLRRMIASRGAEFVLAKLDEAVNRGAGLGEEWAHAPQHAVVKYAAAIVFGQPKSDARR